MKPLLAMLLLIAAGTAQAQPLQAFVRGSQQAIVTAQQGKPFVLALWSLDCVFCRDDLALLGKLMAKYPKLAVVTLATDPPEQRDEVQKVLDRYRLGGAANWQFADTFVERLRYEIDPQWFGELPRTYFYEADGTRSAVSGQLDAHEVERWIKSAGHHE